MTFAHIKKVKEYTRITGMGIPSYGFSYFLLIILTIPLDGKELFLPSLVLVIQSIYKVYNVQDLRQMFYYTF